jgi:hypothetical protein
VLYARGVPLTERTDPDPRHQPAVGDICVGVGGARVSVDAVTVTVNGEERVFFAADRQADRIPWTAQQRNMLYAMADDCGMARSDRHEFAEQILRREVSSWAYLTFDEAARLIDAFTGFRVGLHLMSERILRESRGG